MSSLQRVIGVLLGLQVGACAGWRPETLSPADVIRTEHPAQVRLELSDGRHEVLYRPALQGDSLLGRRAEHDTMSTRALSLTEIREMATRHVSAGRTVALVVGIGAIVAVIRGAAYGPSINLGY